MAQLHLAAEQRELLADLATLIARGGAWRFLRGSVVSADQTHYPDVWDETRGGVARVLARTLWHAHAPFEAVLEDIRAAGAQEAGLLRNTLLQLARVDAQGARFELNHVGNDDVAGIAAHEVGRAFVGWLAHAGHPFRTTPEDDLPTPALGSLAAVYLGLGVVAANAAYHQRTAGQITGNLSYHAHDVARIGGLNVNELSFLLAVQAEVRDDVLPALATLRRTQADAVAAWRAALEDHDDELRHLLGISSTTDDAEAPHRPPEPRAVAVEAELEEVLVTKPNHGRRVFRVPEKRLRGRALLGGLFGFIAGCVAVGVIGAANALLSGFMIFGPVVIGFGVGFMLSDKRPLYRCATCESFLEATAAVCPACGGTIAGDIAHRNERLDAEERLEATRAAANDGARERDAS